MAAEEKVQAIIDQEKFLKARAPELEGKVKTLRQEVKILQGRVANKGKISPQALQAEKQELAKSVQELRNIVFEVELRLEVPRIDAESLRWSEVVRDSSIDHCKKENIEIQW